MKTSRYILAALSVVAAMLMQGCNKNQENTAATGASLTFTVSTKSVTPGDGVLDDGGAMVDLVVVSVSVPENTVDGMKYVSLGSALTETECTLTELTYGPHELYLYANTAGFQNIYPDMATLKTRAQAADKNYSFAAYKEAVFTSLTAGNLPTIANGQMPLTAVVKDLNLSVGTTNVRVELTRPFVKLTVNIYNKSEKTAEVDGVNFSNFNGSTSYLFDHFPYVSNYTPTMSYLAMPAGVNKTIAPRTSQKVFEGLLYENRLSHDRSGERYKMGFHVAYTEGGTVLAEKTLSDLVFQQIKEASETSPMLRMLRNNHITVDVYVDYLPSGDPDTANLVLEYVVNPWGTAGGSVIFN